MSLNNLKKSMSLLTLSSYTHFCSFRCSATFHSFILCFSRCFILKMLPTGARNTLALVCLFCSVDATQDDGRLGRLVNDAPSTKANCKMKLVFIKDKPTLCLLAVQDIQPNVELRYDYGVNDLPWRKKV